MATAPQTGQDNSGQSGGGAGQNPAPAPPKMDLMQMLGQVVRGAVNLRIVTGIGTASVKGNIEGLEVATGELKATVVTNINMIEGDIVNIISEEVVTGEGKEIMEIHKAMIEKAEGIVARNVAVLKDLIAQGTRSIATPEAKRTPTKLPGGK